MIWPVAYTLPRSVASGAEVWAIGDAHGCYDEACAVIETIAATPRVCERRILVTLGDAIDRGPLSIKTLDLWRDAASHAGADELISLQGNHEQMLRRSLALPADGPCEDADQRIALFLWSRNGGSAVMRELGLDTYDPEAIRTALGPARTNYLSSLRTHYRSGGLLFVHAGVDPAKNACSFLQLPWHNMPEDGNHWCWIRNPFLTAEPENGYDDAFVVHGHTTPRHEPFDRPEQIRRYRLNLDFGSFMTGEIGFARFTGDQALVYHL